MKTAVLLTQQILSDIKREGLKAGDMIPRERDLMERYGVGRATVREALRLLEFQGVVRLKPGAGGGPVLCDPTSSHLATTLRILMQVSDAPFRVVVEARKALEPMTSHLAALHMTDEDSLALFRSVERMEAVIDDEATFLDENRHFHRLISSTSGNVLLSFWVDSLLDIIDGAPFGVDYPPHRRIAVASAHRRIADSLSARDAEMSSAEMRVHLEEFAKYMDRRHPEVLERRVSWR